MSNFDMIYTVEPPNKGQVQVKSYGLCREVDLNSEFHYVTVVNKLFIGDD